MEPLPADTPQPDPEWVRFRKAIVSTLAALDRERFFYIDRDRVAGVCPVCRAGFLAVRFHGKACRADLHCSLGCDEREVARSILPRKAGAR